MKAEMVTAVVLKDDDGKVTDICFSEQVVNFILAVTKEYAKDDADGGAKTRREVAAAEKVVKSAKLPKEKTAADGWYSYTVSMAEGLRMTEEQLLKRSDQVLPKEMYPRVALCFFVRGGRHGLQLAFSREAAKKIFDGPVPSPHRRLSGRDREIAKETVDQILFPFPEKRVQLDNEFAAMLASIKKSHR